MKRETQRSTNDVSDAQQPLKSSRRIVEQQITAELGELKRPAAGLFISGLSAGLDIGFSVFLMGVMLTLVGGEFSAPLVQMLLANMYAIGFILVILGRSELFTEHTALAILPVLNGRASLLQLLRLWGLVYLSNLAGGALFALMLTIIGPALGVIEPAAITLIALSVVEHSWWVMLVSAVLAGWLMGLVGWLVAASRDTVSQLLVVWLITAAIGFGGLHHSVVGSVEVLAGLFVGQGVSLADFGHFLLWTTLGNIIGGTFFVSVIKYGHVKRSANEEEQVDLTDEPG